MSIKIDDSSARNGNIFRIVNQAKKTNARDFYWFVNVQTPNGDEVPLMLTQKEYENSLKRAEKNMEDIPSKSWITDILD